MCLKPVIDNSPGVLPASAASTATALQTANKPFRDISGSYAKDAIVRLYRLKLIDGTGSGLFQPNKEVTRAEWMTMLVRLFGIEPVSAAVNPYRDVSRDDWSYPWIMSAVQLGVAEGVSPGKFAPNRAISRQDAAVMIARMAKLNETAAGAAPYPSGYRDQSQIASYALPSVLLMKQLGIMRGDGDSFRPTASITRQEAAMLMDGITQRPDWMKKIRAGKKDNIQMGWQYGQTTKQYIHQVEMSNVNTLSPRWFMMDKDGALAVWGYDAALTEWAHQRGKRIWAMVGNRFDQEATHAMLSDKNKRQSFVTALTKEVRTKNIDGLNVDFENVAPQDRQTFTAFIQELAVSLADVPAVLSVNVSPDMGTDWTEAFDYAALGRSADYIVLMAYDEYWNGASVAGSVSSLPWVKNGLSKLAVHVPASKIIMGLPFYTRDWTIESGGVKALDLSLVEQTATVRSRSLTPSWNPDLGQYVAEYKKQDKLHRIWLEDGRSLGEKTKLGEQLGIAGNAYWSIGGESTDIWVSLRNIRKFASYRFE